MRRERQSNLYFAESSISAASARVRRLISSALKRRTSCEEKLGEVGCELLSPSSNTNASRSTTDVEKKKSNNPGMVLVGIRVTDKKAPSPCWRKPPHNYAGSSRLKKNLTVLKIEMGRKRRVTSRQRLQGEHAIA